MKDATSAPLSAKRRRGRTPHRQRALLGEIRRQITEGRLQPGDRLPVRTELQRQFGASCITVQRVVDRLVADGLVEARGPLGTFVAPRPPHLHRIVLVFPNSPASDGSWQAYYAALARAATQLREEGHDLTLCYATDGRRRTAEFERLQETCRDGLAAGLIFASPPEVWEGTAVVDAPMPRVALSGTVLAGVVKVEPDGTSLLKQAAAALATRKCQRVAVIASTDLTEQSGDAEGIHRIFAEAGVPVRSQWLLGADLRWSYSAARLVRLLFAPWITERPDALLIADDNLEQAVLVGLMAEGIRVGTDVTVMSHANFPISNPSPLPVVRLGFDTVALLRAAIERIQTLRAGGAATPFALPATFAQSDFLPQRSQSTPGTE
jgi:DNA-binding LacI/PurR family transcriptional regulator